MRDPVRLYHHSQVLACSLPKQWTQRGARWSSLCSCQQQSEREDRSRLARQMLCVARGHRTFADQYKSGVRDLAPGAEQRDRNVILLTLAFLSRSLTLAVSFPHLIAQVYPETIAA